MGNSLTLHTGKQYSADEQTRFILNAKKAYNKACKKQHGGFEIDIRYFIGKSLEYKKSFALFLILKKQHTNSVIYNYSEKSLSEKTNISEYIIKTYIKRLITADLCHYSGKHLQCVSLNKIMPERSKGEVIHISGKSTIDSITEDINILLIKNNFSNQDKLRKIKADLIIAKNKDAKVNIKSYKKSTNYADLHPEIKDEKLIDYNILGMRKIAQILGSSLDYAAKFIKKLVHKKIITIKHIVKKYCDFNFSQFSSDDLKKSIGKKSGYFYFYLGSTFHYLGTLIEFRK